MPVDMLEHIFPNSSIMYSLIGAGSNETCRNRHTPQGYAYFDKSENWEEGWCDANYVYRAFDISSYRHNEVYCLWTKLADGKLRYGNPWCPRYMDKGQVFKRTAYVIHYDAQGHITQQAQVVTWIKLVDYHASKTFASGRTVLGVAELQYGFNPDVSDVREHYFYGKGHGLVGFEDGVMATYIGQGTPTSIKPATVIPWINAMRPPVPPTAPPTVTPVPPTPDLTPLGPYALVKLPGSYVNVRSAPNVGGADVGDLRRGDVVTLFAPVVNGWQYIEQPSLKGWVSLQNGAVGFAPVGTPTPEPFTITSPLSGGVITSHFGEPRSYGKHEGTDWALAPNPCAIGTVNALASADGVVDSVRDYLTAKGMDKLFVGYGLYVRLKHVVGADTYYTWYGHISAPLVCVGQSVKRGEPVGVLGSTGNSSGYHVHLSLQHIGHGLPGYVVADVVDPETLLVPS